MGQYKSTFRWTFVAILVVIATGSVPAAAMSCTPGKLIKQLQSICRGNTDYLLDVKYEDLLGCDEKLQKGDPSLEKRPSVTFENAGRSKNAMYTLLMIDPDAPGSSLNHLKFYLHWAVTGISGADLLAGDVIGYLLMKYMPPTPPSGTHRYQILVFESPDGQKAHLRSTHRSEFSLLQFLNDNRMCEPVGSFQYQVEA